MIVPNSASAAAVVLLLAVAVVDYGGGVAAAFRGHDHDVYVHRRTLQRHYSPSLRLRASPEVDRIRRKRHLLFSSSDRDADALPRDASANDISLEQKTWMFREKYPIAYEVARENASGDVDSVDEVPILLLNGFGVGSFHQHSLMRQLLIQHINCDESRDANNGSKRRYVIYGIDYLGQGKSWPKNCDDGNSPDELNLGYSADMWLDQLEGFIEDVIVRSPNASGSGKVHLVGNSVGGYLSTILAHRQPRLVSSLTLLNATPVWGLNLPGWDGKLPAPPLPKIVGRALFDTIRNSDTIDKYLEAAYVHRGSFDGTYDDSFYGGSETTSSAASEGVRRYQSLGAKIRQCTEGNGGHAAFASILWSAPASDLAEPSEPADFYGALGSLPMDVLLLFGEDDPWCTPAVAKRMHTTLAGRSERGGSIPVVRYVSLLHVGHCPNHEAPSAVARVLSRWIGACSSSRPSLTLPQVSAERDHQRRCEVALVSTGGETMKEPWGLVHLQEVSIEESQNAGLIDRVVSSMVG